MLLAAKQRRTHSVDINTEDALSRSSISQHYRSSMVRASKRPSPKRKSTRSFL
jgi:hypothetical protein